MTAGPPDTPRRPREREIHAERHMSDVEAMMWNVDKDPFLSSTFGSLTIFDRAPDAVRLANRLRFTVHRVPRLRQRVAPVFGRLAPPVWQDDPEFDLDFHLRRVALPSPGTLRQLFDLATSIVADPFDRTRPLWEFVVVEGLEGGRAAMVQKMHHTITDGEGGIRMSEQFVDIERFAVDPPVPDEPLADRQPTGSVLDAAIDAVGHGVRRGAGIAGRVLSGGAASLRRPERIPRLGVEAVDLGRSAVRQLTITDHAHSPLWSTRTLQRRLDVLDVPFDEARRASKALEGSLNDFFVTGVAGAAGDYHRRLGAPVDSLRMAMPVSTRSDRSAGGNAFVPTRVLVPTGPLAAPERFALVHDALSRTKGERVIGAVGAMAGVVNLLPTSVVVRMARQQVETVDFTTSNVRAAPFDLFIAGAHILANYPLGPLGGTACNVTMMSYRDQLNMGVHTDAGAVSEPDLLRECLVDGFAELLACGG